MPLKGQAKKNYQKEYMRDYMRTHRSKQSVKTQETPLRPDLKGGEAPLNQSLTPKQETLARLRQMTDALQSESSPLKTESNTRIPLYNYAIHGPGDRVRMPDGQVVMIPELDADGSPIEAGFTGRLVSTNLFRPSFIPDLKPEKKAKKGRR